MNRVLVGLFCTAMAGSAHAATTAPSGVAGYVQPIDRGHLQRRLQALPGSTRELVEMYMEAARRDVLSVTDGCYPDTDYRTHFRNLGERAKGAAVLSSIGSFWPTDLRRRCRQEATAFVREVALTHRAKPNLGYEWQAAYVVAEAAIAGWFLWDELDADLQNAVAEMVIFQADRFIDLTPKMGYRGDTQAETVSWNSSILTLAVNLMPGHPHHAAWDQAAKRYLYNTFATPQDSHDDRPGDDGRPIRNWVVGANLYEDLTLENHNQFHIDYVLCGYRYHIQGAALYWLTGHRLPRALHQHVREMYDRILLHCMTADGFFVYVPDNDWKRYHCWTESCLIHAYLAHLERHSLAATLERRALTNAMALWRSFPPGFAYENQYACGKAWTSRIADIILMHLFCPDPLPAPLPAEEADAPLHGTSRLDTPDLLTHFSTRGSYASSCRGKAGVWVPYVAPRDDAWMLLPSEQNYKPRIDGHLVIEPAVTRWGRGADWFWVIKHKQSTGSAEAFISLPDGSALWAQHLAPADVAGRQVENTISIEKSHHPISAFFAGGQADWQPGQSAWQTRPEVTSSMASSSWFNWQDRYGVAISVSNRVAQHSIELPRAGARDVIRIHTTSAADDGQNLWLVLWPDQTHAQTEARSLEISSMVQGKTLVLRLGDLQVAFHPGTESNAALPSVDTTTAPQAVKTDTSSVSVWRSGHRLF